MTDSPKQWHKRYMKPCTVERVPGEPCGKTPTKFYPFGPRCKDDAPPAVIPDPERTLAALRRKAGIPEQATTPAAPTAIDRNAIASGKRRASQADQRAALAARQAARR